MISHWKEKKNPAKFSIISSRRPKKNMQKNPTGIYATRPCKTWKRKLFEFRENQWKSYVPNICEMYLRPFKRPFIFVLFAVFAILVEDYIIYKLALTMKNQLSCSWKVSSWSGIQNLPSNSANIGNKRKVNDQNNWNKKKSQTFHPMIPQKENLAARLKFTEAPMRGLH